MGVCHIIMVKPESKHKGRKITLPQPEPGLKLGAYTFVGPDEETAHLGKQRQYWFIDCSCGQRIKKRTGDIMTQRVALHCGCLTGKPNEPKRNPIPKLPKTRTRYKDDREARAAKVKTQRERLAAKRASESKKPPRVTRVSVVKDGYSPEGSSLVVVSPLTENWTREDGTFETPSKRKWICFCRSCGEMKAFSGYVLAARKPPKSCGCKTRNSLRWKIRQLQMYINKSESARNDQEEKIRQVLDGRDCLGLYHEERAAFLERKMRKEEEELLLTEAEKTERLLAEDAEAAKQFAPEDLDDIFDDMFPKKPSFDDLFA